MTVIGSVSDVSCSPTEVSDWLLRVLATRSVPLLGLEAFSSLPSPPHRSDFVPAPSTRKIPASVAAKAWQRKKGTSEARRHLRASPFSIAGHDEIKVTVLEMAGGDRLDHGQRASQTVDVKLTMATPFADLTGRDRTRPLSPSIKAKQLPRRHGKARKIPGSQQPP